MLKPGFLIPACLVLTLGFLTACDLNDDAADDVATDDIEVEDDPVGEDDAGVVQTDDQELAEEDEVVADVTDVVLVDHEIEIQETLQSGIVQFVITNEGEEEHGVSIMPADGSENDVVGTMYVDPGEVQQLELELEEGEYIVFCPVDDHWEEHGMEAELTIE